MISNSTRPFPQHVSPAQPSDAHPIDIDTTSFNPERYSSLLDLFEQSVTTFSSSIAYHNLGATLTYRQLEQRSRALAAYFQQQLGIKPGQRIALMLPNCLQYPIALFAILRCGAIAVNINPLYTARELTQQLNDSGAKTLIVMSNFAATVQTACNTCALDHIIVTDLGDEHPFGKRQFLYCALKYVKKAIPHYTLNNLHHYRHCLAKGSRMNYQRPEVSAEQIALLQYTGGTTGVAKGAMLSHANLLANIEQIKALYGDKLVAGQETIVSILPLYHIFALTINCLLFIEIGGTNLLITNPYDLRTLVNTLRRQRFTVISGVNTLYARLLSTAKFCQLDFQHLKIAVAGGMAVKPEIAHRWQQLTGVYLLEGYGLTECAPLVAVNPLTIEQHTGSIGRPVVATQVMLRSEQNLAVATGVPGELCVRGPQVMKGYWQQPEETKRVFDEEGWLHTGDIAVRDEQGMLHLVDRKKDIILVSGFNVYPSEIETVLQMHPAIQEAVAVGIDSETTGEAVKAFVVVNSDAVTKDDVIRHCRQLLTGYKVPKIIEFCDSLPKNALGKVLRHRLTSTEYLTTRLPGLQNKE